jgi:hypothetical protein
MLPLRGPLSSGDECPTCRKRSAPLTDCNFPLRGKSKTNGAAQGAFRNTGAGEGRVANLADQPTSHESEVSAPTFRTTVVAAISLSVVAAGCAGSAHHDLSRVRYGMTEQQVRTLAGPPPETRSVSPVGPSIPGAVRMSRCWLYPRGEGSGGSGVMRLCFTNGRLSLIQHELRLG